MVATVVSEAHIREGETLLAEAEQRRAAYINSGSPRVMLLRQCCAMVRRCLKSCF